jgi:hypothetical protein
MQWLTQLLKLCKNLQRTVGRVFALVSHCSLLIGLVKRIGTSKHHCSRSWFGSDRSVGVR